MAVHTGTVIAEKRLWHEGHSLAGSPSNVLDDVLECHHLICSGKQGVELVVDFALASGTHFVVAALNLEANFLKTNHHCVAKIRVVIHRWNGEVAALVAGLVTAVTALFNAASIPGAFD